MGMFIYYLPTRVHNSKGVQLPYGFYTGYLFVYYLPTGVQSVILP